MSERMVIRKAFVVSMDDSIGDVPSCDILVEDGKIVAVGRDLPVSGAQEVDGSSTIAIPGFIDTHRHTWQTNVRGFLPHCTLDEYLVDVLGNLGTRFRPDDVYLGNLLGAYEALNAGITTLLDWSHVSNTPEHSDEAIHGLRESGIRAVYAHGVPVGAEWWAFSSLDHPQDVRRIRSQYFSSDDQMITLAMATRAPGNASYEVAARDAALARELDIPMTVHIGMRLTGIHAHHVTDMYKLDILGPDVTHIHCTDCSDTELDLIASSGGKVSVASYVELLMGHGYPPTGRLLKRGVRPSLSVDVATSVPGDMFTQMRTALVAERIRAFPADVDVPFAPTLTERDVLSFATIDGARTLGLDHKVGSLTPGKDADIVLLRTDMVNVAPIVDPVATVVVYADTSNIDTVLVRGRTAKRDGKLVGVDLAPLFRRGADSRDYLLEQAGKLPGWRTAELGGTAA